MFYLLPLTQSVNLKRELNADGIVVFQSASLDLDPSKINTAVNLKNEGDILLHVSIRCGEKVIVFNSKTATGNWGPEERESLENRFVGPDTTITVYDHGDRYQILFDYHTVHYYLKRIHKNATSVSYTVNQDKTSPFSDPLGVFAYASMKELVAGTD